MKVLIFFWNGIKFLIGGVVGALLMISVVGTVVLMAFSGPILASTTLGLVPWLLVTINLFCLITIGGIAHKLSNYGI